MSPEQKHPKARSSPCAGTDECYTSVPETHGLEVGTWPNGHSPASLTGNPSTADGEHKLRNNVTHLTSDPHLTVKGWL